uniref:Immunoglobulin V-set domain-containing protein n=1 Tax=Neolamprologus brichardi TaxID=32507 RepID=A0A3Q4GZP4_NEOBR
MVSYYTSFMLFFFFNVSKFTGVKTHCDGRQDGAQCYGALGGTVDIQLMDSTSEISRYQLLKNSLKILYAINNKVIFNTIAHRSHFSPSNGTFRINNLSITDRGKYTLQTFDSDGRSSGEWTLQLFFQGKCCVNK